MLPFSHSVIRPTTGSFASGRTRSTRRPRCRPASAPPRCRPSACRSRCRNTAPCARGRIWPPGSCLPSRARQSRPGTRMPCTFSSQGAGSSFSKISDLDPVELDLHAVGHAAMRQRLDQRFVGVLEAGIFADDGDRHLAFRIVDARETRPASAPCAASAPGRCRRRRALPNPALPCDRPSAHRRCGRRRAPG